MGIGISVFFLAVGAILTFALETEVSGVDIAVIGVILMLVGGIGLATALAFANRGGSLLGTRSVVEDRLAPVEHRPVVREERIVR